MFLSVIWFSFCRWEDYNNVGDYYSILVYCQRNLREGLLYLISIELNGGSQFQKYLLMSVVRGKSEHADISYHHRTRMSLTTHIIISFSANDRQWEIPTSA